MWKKAFLAPKLIVWLNNKVVWKVGPLDFAEVMRKRCFYLALAAVSLWNIWAIWRVVNLAHVPDEVWFYVTALENYKSAHFNPIIAPNVFAYGGIWFLLYHYVISSCDLFFSVDYSAVSFYDTSSMIGDDFNYAKIAPLIAMRAISFFSINVIFFMLLAQVHRGRIWAFFSLMLYLSFPALYWGGKIASPDILSCVLFFAGVWFFKKNKMRAYFFLGLACGVKLSIVPMLLAIIAFHAMMVIRYCYPSLFGSHYRNPNPSVAILQLRYTLWREFFAAASLSGLVFLLCNLFAIADLKAYLKNVEFFTSMFISAGVFDSLANFLVEADARLFSNGKLWDLVNTGNFFYWSSAAAFPAFLCSWFFSNEKTNPVFFVLMFFTILFFLVRQPAFGWNWFPFIFVFPMIISSISFNGYRFVVLSALCIFSFFASYPYVKQEAEMVYEHKRILSYVADNKSFLVQKFAEFSAANVIGPVPKILNLIDIGVAFPGPKGFNESYWKERQKITIGDMILLGDRVNKYHDWLLTGIRENFTFSEMRTGPVLIIHITGKK